MTHLMTNRDIDLRKFFISQFYIRQLIKNGDILIV